MLVIQINQISNQLMPLQWMEMQLISSRPPQKTPLDFFWIGHVVMYSTVLSKSNCNSLIKYNRNKWTIFPESVPLHICVCVYCIGLEIGVLEQGPSFRQSSSSSTAVQSQSWTPPCRQIDLRYHRVSRLRIAWMHSCFYLNHILIRVSAPAFSSVLLLCSPHLSPTTIPHIPSSSGKVCPHSAPLAPFISGLNKTLSRQSACHPMLALFVLLLLSWTVVCTSINQTLFMKCFSSMRMSFKVIHTIKITPQHQCPLGWKQA